MESSPSEVSYFLENGAEKDGVVPKSGYIKEGPSMKSKIAKLNVSEDRVRQVNVSVEHTLWEMTMWKDESCKVKTVIQVMFSGHSRKNPLYFVPESFRILVGVVRVHQAQRTVVMVALSHRSLATFSI